MLIQPLIEKLLSESEVKIEFDSKHCLRSRFNKNNCTNCIEACQSEALQLQGRQVIFDAQKCTSCMICTAVCTNDTFVHTIDFLPLLKILATKETALLTCQKGTHSDNHVTIPCIGLFSEPLLAAMNYVSKGSCYIDISHCPECANVHCLKTLYANMQNLVHKTKEKKSVRLKYLFDKQLGLPSDEKTERRSFLRLVRKNIADMGRNAVSFQLSDSAETKDSYSKNQTSNAAALQYALSITPDARIYERDVLLSYFFSVSTNEQCDCCPSCTGMCPTGALKRKKESDKKHLTFTSARCSGCGLCVNFCRKCALTLKSGFSGDPNITMQITDNFP